MNLGETIHKERSAKHLSQGDLADLLDVSRQSISKWENNSSVPELDKLIKLSEIFDITLDELIKGEGNIAEKQNVDSMMPASFQTSHSHILGFILIGTGVLITLLFMALGWGLAGLLLAIPFLVCGGVYLLAKSNAGLWCSWVLYFWISTYLRFATGTTWSIVLRTFDYPKESNILHLVFAWIEVIVLVILSISMVFKLSKKALELNQKSKLIMLGGWLVWIVLFPINRWFFTWYIANYGMVGGMRVFSLFVFSMDWLRLVLLEVLLVYTVRYFKGKQIEL